MSKKRRRPGGFGLLALAVLLVPSSVVAFSGLGQGTLAAFTDSSAVSDRQLSGFTIANVPGSFDCSGGGLLGTITVSWNASPNLPSSNSGYVIQANRVDGSTETFVANLPVSASELSLNFGSQSLLGLLGGSIDYRIRVFAVTTSGGTPAADKSNWVCQAPVSSAPNRMVYQKALLGLLLPGMNCT